MIGVCCPVRDTDSLMVYRCEIGTGTSLLSIVPTGVMTVSTAISTSHRMAALLWSLKTVTTETYLSLNE